MACDSTATYSCARGYHLEGDATRTCQSDGTWSGLAPKCALLDCGALSPPANGTVDATSTTYGSTATYSCSAGYGPSGASTRACQADGTWTGTTPECVVADCPALSSPTAGAVSATTLAYGAKATYACSSGYRLLGEETRMCQLDGTWTGVAPTCVAIECGPLLAPTNGSVSVTSTATGWVATYSCSSDLALFGKTTRICQPSGAWSGTAPSCCSSGQTVCRGTCVEVETDNDNCGGCGRICSAVSPSTAQCFAGRCLVTLASRNVTPFSIAADATSVYWNEGGNVMKVPSVGGPATTLVSGKDPVGGIAVDATSLYWTVCLNQTGKVLKAPLTGGMPTTLASDQEGPRAIIVDASFVYWSTHDAIMKVPCDGGTPVYLASISSSSAIAVDATSVYWTNPPGAALMKLPLAGAAPSALGPGFSNTHGIAVDGSHAYWTTSTTTTGFVTKVSVNGGAATTLASAQGFPSGIAVDASSVYWTNAGSGSVMKLPLGGGTPVVLASGQNVPTQLVVDSTSVYWINQYGDVRKVTPK